jgi:hypothetical protein
MMLPGRHGGETGFGLGVTTGGAREDTNYDIVGGVRWGAGHGSGSPYVGGSRCGACLDGGL